MRSFRLAGRLLVAALILGLPVASWSARAADASADPSKKAAKTKPASPAKTADKKPAAKPAAAAPSKTPPKKAGAKGATSAAAKKPAAPSRETAKPFESTLLRPLLNERDRALYKEAFAKARDSNFGAAQSLAAQAREKLPAKLLRLIELATTSDFDAIAEFVAANPDWPYLGALRQKAENLVGSQGDAAAQAWFARNPPQTWKGMQALAELYRRAGRSDEADALIREAWISADLDALEERGFLDRHRALLTEQDHIARLDRLLWDDHVPAARRMMTRVGEAQRLLAEARIRLMRRQAGVDSAVARVPAALQNDPGLIFDRLRFRRRNGDMEGAREMLLNLPHNLARPGEWWTELSYVIRRSLAAGDVSLAYRLAKDHRQDGGPSLAEAEFLAGWIALRFLRDVPEARQHFKTLYESVRYPVSLGRAAYWSGRAAEAAGDRIAARDWYLRAARHATTFYGQLAAGRLNRDPAEFLAVEPEPSPLLVAAYDKAELPRLARMMAEIGERERMKVVFRQMTRNAQTVDEFALVARLALAMEMPDTAVRVSRRAEREGAPLTVSGYPVLPLKASSDRLDPALVHAVIRQESGFDVDAVSRAGARGLMQLMPDTARLVAKEQKVAYQVSQLTEDPHYNVLLGRAYLRSMIEDMGGVPAALAAYNAGPSRSRRWMRDNGDPRIDEDAMVDWIETIPFDETRSYVQRVMENQVVYRVRLSGAPRPTTEASVAAPPQ